MFSLIHQQHHIRVSMETQESPVGMVPTTRRMQQASMLIVFLPGADMMLE